MALSGHWLHEGTLIVMEEWRKRHNTVRPHRALRYRPPAPEAIGLLDSRSSRHEQCNWTNRWND